MRVNSAWSGSPSNRTWLCRSTRRETAASRVVTRAASPRATHPVLVHEQVLLAEGADGDQAAEGLAEVLHRGMHGRGDAWEGGAREPWRYRYGSRWDVAVPRGCLRGPGPCPGCSLISFCISFSVVSGFIGHHGAACLLPTNSATWRPPASPPSALVLFLVHTWKMGEKARLSRRLSSREHATYSCCTLGARGAGRGEATPSSLHHFKRSSQGRANSHSTCILLRSA